MKTMGIMFMNKEWLDKAGKEIENNRRIYGCAPELPRDGDMNGNGDPADEIPLSGFRVVLQNYEMRQILGNCRNRFRG